MDGKGAVKCPTEIFKGDAIAIEAWVNLDRYPEKEGYVVYRPAQVGTDAHYDPKVDKTQGYALLIDHTGAFHLQITNTFYGYVNRTTSPAGIVPLASMGAPGRRQRRIPFSAIAHCT